MSNHLALATVTATLKNIIAQAVQNLPHMQSAIEVTSGRPEARDSRFVGVNICLYQTTPNAYFRNQDLLSVGKDGRLAETSMVPVNLHYLITFYGSGLHQEAERLLGATLAALHNSAVLTRAQLHNAVTSSHWLAGSDLDQQLQAVKLTPVSLSLEELAKLWTVFFQTAHALSVAYEVSPILIGSGLPPVTPPIVQPELAETSP